jgi:FSR family fosmidomycin resistance protein-like MFS transporter
MSKSKNTMLTLLGSAHSLNHSLFLVLPLYLSQVAQEFSTTIETIGFIAAVSGFLYGVGALFGGPLSDKIGGVKTLMLGMVFSGVSTFLFFAAHDVTGFAISLLLLGLGGSLYHPTSNTIIAKAFEGKMAEAMGLHGTGGNLGYMFAPLIIVGMGDFLGWRYPLALFGIMTIILSLIIMKLFSWVDTVDKTEEVKTEKSGGLLSTFLIPGLAVLLAYNLVVGLYFKGVDFIFPNFLQTSRGYSSSLKATAVFALFGFGILGQWLSGRISDRIGSKKVLVATSVGIASSFVFLLVVPNPLISVALFIVIYGAMFYGHQPALNSLTGLITPNARRGTVYGVFFFLSFGLGSISIAIATYFAVNFSMEMSFMILLLFSLIALLLSLFAPKQPGDAKR